ncbi:MAG: T9SS type A sorting domain-containing protein [Bacteroidetes bacterium]|nr:T9SS type A sorting domain-containing protein [Bacteroidota bacterium]
MRLYIKLSLLFATASVTQAQISYSISPSKTVSITAPYSQTTLTDVYQVNTGSSKIVLKWEMVLVNLPLGWTVSMCDFGACYGSIPSMSTMDTIPVGGQGFLGLNVDPGTIAGSGIVKAYVYQDGYYSNGDTITWNINSSSVGIDEISLSNGISIYPIPARDVLNVNFKSGEQEGTYAYVIDALGRKILNLSLSEQNNRIDISELNEGVYYFIIENSRKHILKQIIKTE